MRLFWILLVSLVLPMGGALGATVTVKNCHPDSKIDVRLFNAGDFLRAFESSLARNVHYREARSLTCETDSCHVRVTYVQIGQDSTGLLSGAYGGANEQVVQNWGNNLMDDGKTYCFSMDGSQAIMSHSACC